MQVRYSSLLSVLLFLAVSPISAANGGQVWDIPERYMTGDPIAPMEIYDDLMPAEVRAFCDGYLACAGFTKGSDFLDWEDRFQADRCNVFVQQAQFYKWGDEGHRYAVEHEKAHCRGWPPDHPAN